jgi:predicted nuclease with TOPRIM domain
MCTFFIRELAFHRFLRRFGPASDVRMDFTNPSRRRYREEGLMLAVEERLTQVEAKMQQLDVTLARIETVLSSLDNKVDKLDMRMDRLDERMDRLDERMEKRFLWVIGIQMTILITIAGGLFGIVVKLI